MDDYLNCKTCPESDHEGVFCRCESRNIAVAKERRKMMTVANILTIKFEYDKY